jgi:zinc protease
VRGWVSTFRDPGLFEVFVTAREGHEAPELLAALDVELERVRRDVVSEDELARAKARLELSALQSLESTAGKAEQIGFYDLVLGDPSTIFRRLDAYRRLTAADVRKAARRYLTQDARTIVRVTPEEGDGDTGEAEEAAQ